MQRVPALLSGEPGSAAELVTDDTSSGFYWLNFRLQGDAKRRGSKNKHRSSKNRLTKVKGCWVCGQDHLSRDHHPYEQVQAALKKHKDAGAYISAEDVLTALYTEDGQSGSSEDDACSSDDADGEDSDVQYDSANLLDASDHNFKVVANLANNSFVHSSILLKL